jgi:DEAD/DEAH box helicase domain-containing protein
MAHPAEVFTRQPEPAVINPSNPFVLLPHLACAAYELPLTPADERWWGDEIDDGVRELVQDEQLKVRDGRAFWAGQGSPAPRIGLRTGSSVEYRIATVARGTSPHGDDARLIGTVDESRAFQQVHPGAIYLHQGQAWRVVELDLEDHVAYVEQTTGDEMTHTRSETDIRILEVDRVDKLHRTRLCVGSVEVFEQVVGYQRKDARTGEVLGTVDLDLPPSRLITRAFWYEIEPSTLARAGIAPGAWPGTLHAAEHAAIGMLPLFTICDRWDVGGVSTALQADTGVPTIVVYDGYPGGAGIAELGFECGWLLLERTLESVGGCPCASGCPSCVQSPKCGNLNEPLDKLGAIALLAEILSARRVQRPVA